ncbi:MAG: U32 family peptidase [Promethearchaeota archaeon]|nr:MAG: U32 family peptidase [Candidatus Lokiarchaeota archaeon]
MVELLIPAQNKKSVQAAIGYADAIYFGVETFNMRMHAQNITQADLPEFIQFCHDNNLKAFLTSNIIIYEGELDLLRQLIESAYSAEVDAVIVHDLATIQLAKEIGIPFHISTQASISNSMSAKFFEQLGAERAILARELTLEQIKEIGANMTTMEIEAFVHGAMCTSISGRCYLSEDVTNNPRFSANRGKCLQPCRQKWTLTHENGTVIDYDGFFFLNSKDLCMIEYIPELIEAGITSLKVEGRMRAPRYIETVSRLYRKAIDAHFNGSFTKELARTWKEELASVYNRGFSTGFYFGIPTYLDVNQKSGNMAYYRKEEVGTVVSYYREKQVAKLSLQKGQFKPGDVLFIEGGPKGTFYKHEITEMFHKNRQIQQTPDLGKIKDEYLITIKVESPVKRTDRVFVYMDKRNSVDGERNNT